MKKRILEEVITAAAVSAAAVVGAEVLDRPSGIKIGERMTLRPSVSLSASYDTNVGSRHSNQDEDIIWTVNPNLGLDYRAERWSLDLNVHYNYHNYSKSSDNDYNHHSYGETLRWNWRNSDEEGFANGWAAMLSESFEQITMSDDMSLNDGRGYTADRRQFNLNGAIQRRFNENFHSDLNANYYLLDYQNDLNYGSAMYGWQRWQAGLMSGYAPSKWTDILASLQYQGYLQDNCEGSTLSGDSQGYSAMLGLGTYMTERISYRLLAGWSRFEYAGNSSSSDGFTYSLSGKWKIGETWDMMLLASSYYQPSEREYSAKSRVDALSWGLAKSLIRGKLRGTLDLTYRHTTHEMVGGAGRDYELDVVTGRLGFNYTLNRFLSAFAYAEYQRSWNDESDRSGGYCDYDRLRGTCGLRLSY